MNWRQAALSISRGLENAVRSPVTSYSRYYQWLLMGLHNVPKVDLSTSY